MAGGCPERFNGFSVAIEELDFNRIIRISIIENESSKGFYEFSFFMNDPKTTKLAKTDIKRLYKATKTS